MKSACCPDADALAVLLESESTEPVSEYAEHLETCPHCQRTLAELSDDSPWLEAAHFLSQTQDSGQPGSLSEPALDRVMGQLKNELPLLFRDGEGEPGADEWFVSFLRPSDRPDLLGYLGDFAILEVIGRGGMGVVFKGLDQTLNRVVAIKVLLPHLATSATPRRRFIREAKAAATVCHDHVVTLHGIYETEGLPYLVMQYIGGESLQARLDRVRQLPIEDVVRIGQEIASGLAAAHAEGLVHRDVKPANILLHEGDERVTITDFGLARAADDVSLTQSGVIAGTPLYMSPEQARGEPVDARSDLFSLGSVLYALCAGRAPFHAETTLAVFRCLERETPCPLRELNPAVPPWLESCIGRLLAKQPEDRFHSAREIATLLRGYLAHLRAPESSPLPSLRSAQAGTADTAVARRPPGILWLAVLLLLAVLSGMWVLGLASPGSGKDFRQEYSQSLEGAPWQSQGLELFGPDAEQCVKEDPAGLRITLPTGFSGERPGVGVSTTFGVQGDFEITVGFEILKEPEPQEVGAIQTRLSLEIVLDSPHWGVATISRKVVAHSGTTEFLAWQSTWDESRGRKVARVDSRPATTKKGRLRLVRSGGLLSFYGADESDSSYTLIGQYPIDPADVKAVHLVGSTGDSKASLDVRFTNLVIRATALPGAPPGTQGIHTSRGWLIWLATLVLALSLAGLAGWIYLRHFSRATNRSSPGRWLIALGMIALVAVGAIWWFVDGKEQTDPGSEVLQPQEPTTHLALDFKKGLADLAPAALYGGQSAGVVKTDEKGLRIELAEGRMNTNLVGVEVPITIVGDFDISVGYELLMIGTPEPKYGAGVGFRVILDEGVSRTALISRTRRPAGEHIGTYRVATGQDGKPRYEDVREFKASAASGRLRMQRRGSHLQCIVAEGDQEAKELRSMEIGSEDVRKVQIYATTNNKPIALDVRFTDLDIHADRIQGRTSNTAPGAPSQPVVSRRWRVAVALGGLAALALLGLGVWTSFKSNRRATPTAIPFSCPDCGKTCKVKAALAGKKVKCPQCGQRVALPAADLRPPAHQ